MLIVDPPEGWRYGFPKQLTQKKGQLFEEWFLEMGYPQSLIDKGLLKYCGYWEEPDAS